MMATSELTLRDRVRAAADRFMCRRLGRHTRVCRGRFDHIVGSLNQLPRRDTFTLPNGQVLTGVHPPTACEGRGCPIHHPSGHAMVSWPLLWRGDRGLMERVCAHGCGHPDPDHMAWYATCHNNEDTWAEGVHGCCGCETE